MASVSSAPGDDSAVAVETEQGTVGNANDTLPSWSGGYEQNLSYE